MLKGVNKAIIEVNETGNKYFEKAIFFVNPKFADKDVSSLEKKAKEYIIGHGDMESRYFITDYQKNTHIKRWRRTAFILLGYISLCTLGLVLYFVLK